jgi:mRNA-degrading endonuclease YafQ of YafQ-DinJ toxin-antitoxin module
MTLELYYSPEFKRAYKALTRSLQLRVKERGALFCQSPFHPTLRTHKLMGKHNGFWAFSVTNKIRIIFEFQGEQKVLLHTVGDHSVYRQ